MKNTHDELLKSNALRSRTPSGMGLSKIIDPLLEYGLGAGGPMLDLHKTLDQDKIHKDLIGANGPEAYFKRLAE